MAVPRIGRRDGAEPLPTNPEASEVVVPLRPLDVRLNDASEILMEYLPTDTVSMVREAAEKMSVPLWQMILGYVMRCDDGRLWFSPHLLSQWATGGRADAARACGTCGKEFVSRFPDAAYCCERCYFGKLSEFGHNHDCSLRG